MSSAAAPPGASEALAAFAVGTHRGDGYERALAAARSLWPTSRDAFVATKRSAHGSTSAADAAIVAAARETATLRNADEETVVRSIAVGREAARRIARALTLDRAWDADAVAARIGTAVAAACAAGLDAEQARNAIGIAATQAAGLRVAADTDAGSLTLAKTAGDALEAAILARHGFTGAPASLEGRRGLAALMASRFDAAVLTDGLGTRWISVED